jgi:general secretion pathway protein F
MSLFAYEAIDARGRRRKGEIEAESEHLARRLLKDRQLVPRRLQVVRSGKQESAERHGRSSRLSRDETMLFLQQLAALFGAGVPLAEALAVIAEGMDSARSRRVVATIRQQVLEGSSLADALRARGMDDVVCNMVAAGEETGQMEAVALRLAEMLEHRQRLRQEILSATLYPAIVMGFGLLVMLFLLAFVIPQVVTVFDRAGGELPLLTVWVIAISTFLRQHGLLLLAGMIAALLLFRLALQRPHIRKRFDSLLLRIPGLAALLARIETSRFAHTLGMLLAGGVPVLSGVLIAGQGLRSIPFREAAEAARNSLREGGSLAASLTHSGLVPHLATQLIRVGEQSGRLDAMLLRVAETYENEVSRLLKRTVVILEPALVMLMALVVGALALAILLPIVQMNELIR